MGLLAAREVFRVLLPQGLVPWKGPGRWLLACLEVAPVLCEADAKTVPDMTAAWLTHRHLRRKGQEDGHDENKEPVQQQNHKGCWAPALEGKGMSSSLRLGEAGFGGRPERRETGPGRAVTLLRGSRSLGCSLFCPPLGTSGPQVHSVHAGLVTSI